MYTYIYIYIYVYACMYIYIYIYNACEGAREWVEEAARRGVDAGVVTHTTLLKVFSIVLEAPIPKRSFGDKTSLYVVYTYVYIHIYIYIYSDKQQHTLKIGWRGDAHDPAQGTANFHTKNSQTKNP